MGWLMWRFNSTSRWQWGCTCTGPVWIEERFAVFLGRYCPPLAGASNRER
ncbi:hypothetical protein GBA52_015724 [Prunus armeniaca]|nr:hypothetical protein GBA52_015724 [Prunus armeniaca]